MEFVRIHFRSPAVNVTTTVQQVDSNSAEDQDRKVGNQLEVVLEDVHATQCEGVKHKLTDERKGRDRPLKMPVHAPSK